MIDWTALKSLVAENRRFILTSHQRPDCDALGSELGMLAVLEALGKEVRIVNCDEIPKHLQFIDVENRIEVLGRDVQPDELLNYDVLMVLDTSAWAQLGTMGDVLRKFTGVKVVIDHHVSEDDLGAISFKNSDAEAAGRLVVEAADALGVKLTARIAKPLLAAITTDTGWFRFASVSGDTYRVAGRLVDAGARPEAIYCALYEQETLARTLLRGRVLAQAQIEAGGRLIYSAARLRDLKEVGAEPGDTEDVINLLLRVAGTSVALLFSEQAGAVKVSFRSRGDLDVRRVAEQFGGGGHKLAAGATIAGDFEPVLARVLDAVRKAM